MTSVVTTRLYCHKPYVKSTLVEQLAPGSPPRLLIVLVLSAAVLVLVLERRDRGRGRERWEANRTPERESTGLAPMMVRLVGYLARPA